MFDLGFSELLLIGVVALVVIGPERLPKVARTVGAWLGRLNRYVSEVKGDIDRELRLDELRKMQQDMKDTAQKYEILADETGREIQREVEGVEKAMQPMAATDGTPSALESGQESGQGEENATARLVASSDPGEDIQSGAPVDPIPALLHEDIQADATPKSPAPADRPANAA